MDWTTGMGFLTVFVCLLSIRTSTYPLSGQTYGHIYVDYEGIKHTVLVSTMFSESE